MRRVGPNPPDTSLDMKEAHLLYRDAFVREYIKDFNAKNAMHRLGVEHPTTARNQGGKLLREKYVLQRLDETVRQLQPTDIVSRGQVMSAMWKEANDPLNTGSERISAIAHCAKMLGMDRTKTEEDTTLPMNVMMIPVMNVEDWAASAIAAQELLKARAKQG